MFPDVNLPAGNTAGTDWSSTLQNIVAYGAGRFFDSQAVSKIYKSTGTPMLQDTDGTLYPAGTPAPSVMRANQTADLGGIPLIFWLIGGVGLFFVLKD